MIRPSPDARWASPGFVLRRLAGRPTVRAEDYAPAPDPERLAGIGARVARARGPGAPAVALLVAPTPRSGTNLVEALIAAHPRAATAPGGMREVPALVEAPRLAGFASAMGRRHPSAGLDPEEWLGLALAGLLARAAAERPEAGLILLKDPHVRRLDLRRAVLPGARLVVVLRDGRRTVDSAVRSWRAPGGALGRLVGRSFADHCRDWALATAAALEAARGDPSAVVVRFEDAARDPAGTARRLWKALGLGPAPAEALARAAAAPVLGSSTHSREGGAVDWAPRARSADFDPAGRALDWPARWERIFAREAGAAQARLEAEAPAGHAARDPASGRLVAIP